MTQTIICSNPYCARRHALFWYIAKDGKKTLSFECDHLERYGVRNRMGEIDQVRTGRGILRAPEGTEAQPDVPERWSAGYRDKQQKKQQTQLVMFYENKPGDRKRD